MKTLKSKEGSFGIIDFTSAGIPRTASADGYTDANNMKKMGIWKATSYSSAEHMANLPVEGYYGFLIVLQHEANGGVQFFVTMLPNLKIYARRFYDGYFQPWYKIDVTEVTN